MLDAIPPGLVFSGSTHNLQLVLPELLLPRLIQEREFANMVHEDVSQDR